jgi:tRNA threonylcarbamoyl adenosine modification protein YeaZ
VLVLAFDTSTPAVTVAVVEVGGSLRDPSGAASFGPGDLESQTLAERTEIATNRHGELLAPLIREVLATAGTSPSDLDAIGVGLGPGPFTGLRVGIVTAKAMGDALGVATYGECSLDVMARGYPRGGDPFAVLTDARRKQVYWARYDGAGARLDGPELGRPADVAELLRGRAAVVAGAGAELYRADFAGFEVAQVYPYPKASELARMGGSVPGRSLPSDGLEPLYLRRPDAQPPGRPKQVTPA